MSDVICTTCCKAKKVEGELLPAMNRYESSRIHIAFEMSQDAKQSLLILSGKFGLLNHDTPIPYYDQRLTMAEVPSLLELVCSQLRDRGVRALNYIHYDSDGRVDMLPYETLIVDACLRCEVRYTKTIISGSEPFPDS